MRNSKSCFFCKNQLNSITTRTGAGFLENPNTGQETLSSRYVLQAAWNSGKAILLGSGGLGEGLGDLRLGGRADGSKQEGGAPRMTAVPVSTSTGQGHWGTAVSVLDVTGGNATAGSRGQA